MGMGRSVGPPQPKKWLPDDMRGVRISMGNDVIVLVEPNGNIRLKPGASVEGAAMAFWQAINDHHPFKDDYMRLLGMLRTGQRENERLKGLLKENGIDYRTGGPEATISATPPARDIGGSGEAPPEGDPGSVPG